jgi:chemotaxis protein MotA
MTGYLPGFPMLQIGGIVLLFICVFGVYIATGGAMDVVMHAAPHEMATIFGSALSPPC